MGRLETERIKEKAAQSGLFVLLADLRMLN